MCTQLGVADDDVVKVLELLHGNLSEALHEEEEEKRCHSEEPASDSVFDEEIEEEEEEEEVEEVEEGEESEKEEQDGEVDERTECDESEKGTSSQTSHTHRRTHTTYTHTHAHTHHIVTVGPCSSVFAMRVSQPPQSVACSRKAQVVQHLTPMTP